MIRLVRKITINFLVFQPNIERRDAIFSLNAIENGQNVPNKYSMNAGPVLPLMDSEAMAIREYLKERIEKKKESIIDLDRNNNSVFKIWLEKMQTLKIFKNQ